MIRLSCASQNYEWGKPGETSIVGRMCSMQGSEPINQSKPYAELWMGTHEKGASKIFGTDQLLSVWLRKNPHVLGDKMQNLVKEPDSEVQLPFLFKVLSVNKALSIQAHPDKAEACRLHERDPKNYPDPNHKPEMAIALTSFEMLCNVKELRSVIGDECYEKFSRVASSKNVNDEELKNALRACFTALMNRPSDCLQTALQSLVNRIRDDSVVNVGVVDAKLILRLSRCFPGDVGCFAPFFLNHFYLEPGEAVFLGPNEPHAYLFDCIECMACSDNTIRAGLTPKYKDVDTLCRVLSYRCVSPELLKVAAKSSVAQDRCVTIYSPPISEFAAHRITVRNLLVIRFLILSF
ncbi:unnamed protein product [Soboliphyme baturini]|uniref:mannose-6-phosphate isomerase n=1 Tax=Soboliphyme baturini TaxID=241478 RepID=A0A183IRN2_9BILA|nr:unnamed protein product [Soboliphyme baturini]